MKIVIVGAGAIGSLLAAMLSKTKEEVWVLEKDKERSAIINKHGISIEGVSGSWNAKVKATVDVSEVDKADLVLICVKSYDTKKAVLSAKPLLHKNTVVLTLQNGIGNIEVISEIIGENMVMGGATSQGATLIKPAHVRHAGKGETVIGFIDGRTTVEIRSIRELFNKAGLEIKISRDIKSVLWSKLIVNVGINAISALTRMKNGKLIEFEGTRKILRAAVSEAVRIAKRKRVKLIYDDPLAKVEAVCESTAQNISSMLQDVLNKKKTEIDYINGVVVRLGQELSIPTPVNSLLVDLVKTIESGYESVVENSRS
ncbi:MAG: 2-dehydropantoate 2-reductase [Candidatus Omnitrophota bacterium]|jgi:2-dehydropantoate 2-reductase|nr:MAG: 2-dehydropantoate 2-reductase [Candidatus Omnitrophota bacterium]